MSSATLPAYETRPFVAGAFIPGRGVSELAFDPSLGRELAAVSSASTVQVGEAVVAAAAALPKWPHTPPRERSKALMRIAVAIEAEAPRLARIEADNCGKPACTIPTTAPTCRCRRCSTTPSRATS